MADEFEAQFEVSFADFAALHDAHARRSVLALVVSFVDVVAVTVLGIILLVTSGPKDYASDLLLLATFVIVIIVLRKVVVPRVRKSQFRRMQPMMATHIFADTSGIRCTGKATQTTYRWDAISRITEREAVAFLWINRDCAVIIPKRGFSTPAMAERFITFSKSQIGAAPRNNQAGQAS